MCLIASLFFFTETEKKHVRGLARFQQHGDTRCHQICFSAKQGAEGNSRNSDRNNRETCTILCHHPKMDDPVFPPVMRLVLDDPKQ